VDIGPVDIGPVDIGPVDIGTGGPVRTSYLDAVPPHIARSAGPRRGPRAGRRRRGRAWRRKIAPPALVLLGAAALALTAAIVGLVSLGLAAAGGSAAASEPLAVPAPAFAGGLPRHYWPEHNPVTRRLIRDFTRRFSVISGSEAGQPTGVYREPGIIDPATGGPGWVMYLGYNSAANLGAPGVTIGRVMVLLTASSATRTTWRAAPGPRGGSARCATARFGTVSVSLCAWATEHTVGALMSPRADTKGNELAVLMPLMRLDLQPG